MPAPQSPIQINIRYERDGQEVPEYECREACVYANYNWRDWQDLDWYERAAAVGQYRMHHLIESHVQDKVQKEAARKNAKANIGSRGRGR